MGGRKNALLGLGLFGESVIQLIDRGIQEPLETIAQKMSDNDLVTYLTAKYKMSLFDPSLYDVDALNEFFCSWSSYVDDDKLGIHDTNSGLLAIPIIILDQAEQYMINWKNP